MYAEELMQDVEWIMWSAVEVLSATVAVTGMTIFYPGNKLRKLLSEDEIWGGGSEPPFHQLGGLGERCKLPSGV